MRMLYNMHLDAEISSSNWVVSIVQVENTMNFTAGAGREYCSRWSARWVEPMGATFNYWVDSAVLILVFYGDAT
jgi:hypothetical protein